MQAHMSSCKDIQIRQRIIVTPFNHETCHGEMDAIEGAARDAFQINVNNPMLPAPTIIRPDDHNALHCLGMTFVGTKRKLLIE
jgi:hypothetical protein